MTDIELDDGFLSIKNSPTVMMDQKYVIATDNNKTMILVEKDNTSDSQKWALTKTGSKLLLKCEN